jgi:serine/threonine protein kinase
MTCTASFTAVREGAPRARSYLQLTSSADIKPSNILFNSKGQVKICDFGVSGELINSIADTFVGTSTYMSPERIQGAQYTVKSDVWSLGISLIELALGRFPFADDHAGSDDSDLSDFEGTLSPSARAPTLGLNGLPARRVLSPEEKEAKRKRDKRKSKGVSLQGGGMTMSILELLQHIVNEPAPKMTPEGRFPPESEEFVEMCLLKDPDARWTPQQLLVCTTPGVSKALLTTPCSNIHGASTHVLRTLISRNGQARFERTSAFSGSLWGSSRCGQRVRIVH